MGKTQLKGLPAVIAGGGSELRSAIKLANAGYNAGEDGTAGTG